MVMTASATSFLLLLDAAIHVVDGEPFGDPAASPRLEPSMALGGVSDRLSWLANLGARVRLEDSAGRAAT